jgi:hypothetical protein
VFRFATWGRHSVMYRGKQPRISFIFDYFPPPAARGA